MVTVQVKELEFEYNKEVLRSLDLTASKGEVVSLVGPNGAVKTIFLNASTGY